VKARAYGANDPAIGNWGQLSTTRFFLHDGNQSWTEADAACGHVGMPGLQSACSVGERVQGKVALYKEATMCVRNFVFFVGAKAWLEAG